MKKKIMIDTFNIADLFFRAAKRNAGKTAIIFKESKISFADLERRVMDSAHYFLKKGINKGDRVLILVPMSIDLYRIVLALFKIGATAVFLDEWVSKKRMEECCRIVNCKAMIGIFKARIFSFFSSELRKIPIKLGVEYSGNIDDINKIFTVTKKNDTALITFTTGSTGSPKAAKRTHEFLHHQFLALIEKIRPVEDDIDMPVLPIVLLINLATGTTSVIADFKSGKPNSLQPKKIIQQIKQHSVNRMTASPFFIKEISKYIISKKLLVRNMRNIFTGGAPVFPNEAEIYVKAFPDAKVEIVYGSTEAEPISAINARELIEEKNNIQSQGLMVGKADKNIEVKIIKIIDKNIYISSEEELLNIELPVKEIGEIIVSGSHV
ncbi:MAG: AMP-binding protein, partial [Chitinophagaceae bacterium]